MNRSARQLTRGRPILPGEFGRDLVMLRRCRQRLEIALDVSESGSDRRDDIERALTDLDRVIHALQSWGAV